MGYAFNPFTGNFDVTGAAASVPDPLTVNNLTVNTLLTAAHIHGNVAGSLYIHVKNTSNTTLAKGTPVYAVGAVGDTTTLEVAAADSADPAKSPAIGVLNEQLIHNASGHAVMFGEITGVNTGSYQINDELYVAAGGGLTATKPVTGYVQAIAIVGRVHSSTGTLLIKIGSQMDDAAGSGGQIQVNNAGNLGTVTGFDIDASGNLGIPGDINLDDGGSFTTTLQTITPTDNRTISLPNATGTVGLVAGSSGNVAYNLNGAYAGLSTLNVDVSGNLTLSGRLTNSYTSLASAPAKQFTGTWFTGGTATTTKPHFLIEPAGTTSTNWSTGGTGLGVNAPSGWTGRLLDLQLNGASRFVVGHNFIALQNPDGTATGGNARGANAVDLSTGRTNAVNVASGNNSFQAACTEGRAMGIRSVVFHNSIASGNDSFATSGGEASGSRSVALAFGNASGQDSFGAAGGNASNTNAVALGSSASATGIRSIAFNWGAVTPNIGQFAYGFRNYGAQWTVMGMAAQTTTSSATELFGEGFSGYRQVIPANTTWAGTATILARTRNGISNAHFQRQVMIKRDGSNNTTLVDTVKTLGTDIKSNADFGATVTITADDTNESLKVEGTAKVGGTVSSVTSSGTTCTVTMSANHGLLTGDYVTIAGAAETAYNGTFTITNTRQTFWSV